MFGIIFYDLYTSNVLCVAKWTKIFISPGPACNLIQNSPDYYCFKKTKIVPLRKTKRGVLWSTVSSPKQIILPP